MKSIRTLSHFFAFVLLGICFAPIALAEETAASTITNCGQVEGECLNPDATTTLESDKDDPNCPSRASIIRCAGKHLDTNQNGKLDRTELESAIASLPWYARGILQILGSVDKMVRLHQYKGN
jgi:hypothetical protein